MHQRDFLRLVLYVFSLLAIFTFSGCGPWHVRPEQRPVEVSSDNTLAGVSLAVQNQEKDVPDFVVPFINGQQSFLITNKRAWADVIVSEVKEGLRKKGAQIEEDSPRILSVSMPSVVMPLARSATEFEILVDIASGSKWKKAYKGVGGASHWSFKSSGVEGHANRASSEAITNAVEAIVSDAELHALLREGAGK